jgi:hypothetical protein
MLTDSEYQFRFGKTNEYMKKKLINMRNAKKNSEAKANASLPTEVKED